MGHLLYNFPLVANRLLYCPVWSTSFDARRLTIIMLDSGIFKLCKTMLKMLTNYPKIMPENFTKEYAMNVIVLDLSQKGSNCQNYAKNYVSKVFMPKLGKMRS